MPEVYLAAADRFGAPVDECLVVEDMLGPTKQAYVSGFREVGVYDDSSVQDYDDLRMECDVFIEGYGTAFDVLCEWI